MLLALVTNARGVSAEAIAPTYWTGTGGGPGPDPVPTSITDLTFQSLWLNTSNNTTGVSLALDSSGGVHAGYLAYTPVAGAWPVYYGYCASQCNNASHWTSIVAGNAGMWGGYARLALDPAGHPRMMWYSQVSISVNGIYRYAECNTSCTDPTHWTSVDLASIALSPSFSRYFELDGQGHPRFVYHDTGVNHTGTYYDYCDASCTSANQWHEVQISTDYLTYDYSLAFDTSGGAHIAYRDAIAYPDRLGYIQCTTACTKAASWTSTVLLNKPAWGYAFSLRLDAQDQPRLALYFGDLGSGDPHNDLLSYWWCNSNCAQTANWFYYSLGLPAKYGEEVDLALDAQGLPHLAYYVDAIVNGSSVNGIGYAACTANCESANSNWQTQFVETTNDLDTSDPVPLVSGCTLSYWLEDHSPSLVLDSGGNPRIGYTALHYQGGKCTIHEDIRLNRFTLAGSSTPPVTSKYKVFLPGVMKN